MRLLEISREGFGAGVGIGAKLPEHAAVGLGNGGIGLCAVGEKGNKTVGEAACALEGAVPAAAREVVACVAGGVGGIGVGDIGPVLGGGLGLVAAPAGFLGPEGQDELDGKAAQAAGRGGRVGPEGRDKRP